MVNFPSYSSGLGGGGYSCVGKPIESYAVSGDVSCVSISGVMFQPKVYVDNSLNQSLGRVGMPIGTHVQHKDGSVTISPYIKTYVDNPRNQELKRVGLPIGACVQHKDGSITNELPWVYFDISVCTASFPKKIGWG